MCGNVGMAGLTLTAKDEDAFKTLLLLDTVRGVHSTGVAIVHQDYSWDVVKRTGCPDNLFDSKRFTDSLRGSNICLIGHNRSATIGKKNQANAHPFEFPNVVGTHNGTLRDTSPLENAKDYDTDSEAVYRSINDFGMTETMPKLRGAYALTFWDKRDKSLTLLRNEERTLYYYINAAGDKIYWASEDWMLTVALRRNNIDIKPDEIEAIEPGVAMRFFLDAESRKEKLIQFEEEKFTPYVKPPVQTGGYSKSGNAVRNGGTAYGSGDPLLMTYKVVELDSEEFSIYSKNGVDERRMSNMTGYIDVPGNLRARVWYAAMPKDCQEAYNKGHRRFRVQINGKQWHGSNAIYQVQTTTMTVAPQEVSKDTEKK